MSAFDEIMENCPFLKSVIEEKISSEIKVAVEQRETEIAKLQSTIDSLTATILMNGGK